MEYAKQHLESLIDMAVRLVLSAVEDETPKVAQHAQFGMFDLAPQNLAVWYLFDTKQELELARENGLAEKLCTLTLQTLRRVGYPAEAFEETLFPAGGGKMEPRSVKVFVSSDDKIGEQDNGDYFHY